MTYALIIIFVAVHLAFGNELGYSTSSPAYTHLTYQFQHVGWIHLALNGMAMVSFGGILKKVTPEYLILSYAYLVSVLASFLSARALPTVGASGMVYAMSGMFISISLIGERLRIMDIGKFSVFLVGVLVSLAISWARSDINLECHLWGLAIGLIVGINEGHTRNH